MTELLNIIQLGNPTLRKSAKLVRNITDKKIVSLIDDLIVTAEAHKGVGIAAPQVDLSYRLFIISSHPSDRYPHAPTMQPTAIINPQIIDRGTERVKDWEGCLSVPNTRGLVPRYREIEVEYTTKEGTRERKVLTDFIARIFQHELDHLDGKVFLDRIESEADLYTEAEYRELLGIKN